MRTPALALTASLFATACTGTMTPPPVAARPPEGPAACGADQLGSYIGVKATPAVRDAITGWRGEKAVRFLPPGGVMTMDYRFDRLNVILDASDVITELRCG